MTVKTVFDIKFRDFFHFLMRLCLFLEEKLIHLIYVRNLVIVIAPILPLKYNQVHTDNRFTSDSFNR